MDHPLYWGRGQALDSVLGTEVLEDVTAGNNYPVIVDHSVDGVFAFAAAPEIEAVDDVNFLLCCDGTNGEQFTVLVMVGIAFTGGDYGYGTGDPDIIINWSREGVLSGPA